MKKIKIEPEFLTILKEIKSENKTIYEWREIESSDMFQSNNYCGGFDATEDKFTFSYYDNRNREFWFEVSLDDIGMILKGEVNQIQTRIPDQ